MKIKEAEAPLQKAGVQLSEKEIASARKTAEQWRRLPERAWAKKIKFR
jgi:hypothetical protein